MEKSKGHIVVSSVNTGKKLVENILAFDKFIQIIDSAAKLTIDKKKYNLKLGEGKIKMKMYETKYN